MKLQLTLVKDSFLKNLGKPKDSKLLLALIPALKQTRTRQVTTIALTLITISFFGLFAINPTLGTIADLQKQLDDDNFVHQQLQVKIANLTTLQQKYSDLQDSLTYVMSAVPSSPAIDLFVAQAHGLAPSTNVHITRMQTFPVDITPLTNSAKYTNFAFTLELEGDFDSLKQYITSLANLSRLVTLDVVTFSKVGKVDNTFRLSIRGEVYFKADNL